MTDPNWEEQFRQFLRKTGDDFRRASEEIKAEAQKLLDAAMDPEKQQRVRDRLNELSVWARKTAHGVAGAVEEAAVKAEAVFFRTPEKPGEGPASSPAAPPGSTGETPKAPRARSAARGGTKPRAPKGKPRSSGTGKGGKRKR
jgi:hypothetical protein